MATLPLNEPANKYLLLKADAGCGPDCHCICHGAAAVPQGPALGLRARLDTFEALLPAVRGLIRQLQELGEAGKLAEVDTCLLHILEDWIVASKAEIDG